MTTRVKRMLFAVGAGAMIAAISLVIAGGDPPGPSGPAADAAREACGRARAFRALVARDAAADVTADELARAIASATRAAEIEPSYVPLQSGLETLQIALDRDDAGAANVGMRVVRAQCKPFGGIE